MSSASVVRINRNILECKYDFRIVSFLRLSRINRNILECKYG